MANIQDILFILIQGFSGGVAGYITNKYAVNMIFKEYTPLKIGGAVKKNKLKFIEEVSELVERDIINSQTLNGAVKSEDFQKVIDSICKDFITNSLNSVFDGVKLKDIPNIQESSKQSITFIEQNLQEELPRLIDNISDKIDIRKLLSNQQLDAISGNIVDTITDTLENDSQLEELLSCIYRDNKDIALNDILSEDIRNNLIDKISTNLNLYVSEIIENKEKSLEILEKAYELFGLEEIISNLKTNLDEKTVLDIISEDGIEEISSLMSKKLKLLLSEEDNREKLKKIICELLEKGKSIDVALFEILPEDLAESLMEYLESVLPKLTPHISNWIVENREKIDSMINSATEESVQKMGEESIRGLERFAGVLSTISETLRIVDRASDMVKNYQIDNKTGSKLYLIITDFLEKTKVSDIIYFLEDKLKMDDEQISEKLLDLIDSREDDITKSFVNNYKNKKISEFIDLDLEYLFKSKLIPYIYDWIRLNKDKVKSKLDLLIKDKGNLIFDKKISDLIGENNIENKSKKLPRFLSKYLNNNKHTTKKVIENLVLSALRDLDFEDVIKNNREKIILTICSKFNVLRDKLISDMREKEIKDLIDMIKDKESFSMSLSEKLKSGIDNNIDRIFDNNIKRVIYNNLIKLDEDEICDIAQSFMGKQLKPLSYFGAFLGSLAGIIFAFIINGGINVFGFYNTYQTTLILCLIMGVVGVLTNVIALWMIFHPYEKNLFVSKIPVFKIFAQGYIPAHKESFANGMAHFIDNELLKGKRVETLFDARKDKFSETILNNLSKNKFKILIDLAKENKNSISRFLYEFILNKCISSKKSIAKSMTSIVNDTEIKSIYKIKDTSSVYEKMLLKIVDFEDNIIDFLQSKLNSDKKINQVIPENIALSITKDINKTIDDNLKLIVENTLREEFIKSVVFENNDLYGNITSKNLGELIGEKGQTKVSLWIKNDLENYIVTKTPDILNNLLENYMKNNMDEDDTIGDIFNSKVKTLVDENLVYITSILMQKLYSYIVMNKDYVSNLIIDSVKSQLNFFVKMAYEFMNGDYIVRLVIENIIDTKLDTFIDDTMYSTNKTVSMCMNTVVYNSTMKDLGLDYKEINSKIVINNLVENIQKDKEGTIVQNVSDLLTYAFDEVKEIQLNQLIQNTNIKSLESIYELLNPEINTVISQLSENYYENVENINKFIDDYINDNIINRLFAEDVNNILEITNIDLDYSFKFIADRLEKSTETKDLIVKSIDTMYSKVENKKLIEFLDENILISDGEIMIDSILKDLDFNENNQMIVDKIIFNFIESEFEFVDEATKAYLIKGIVDALLDTGIYHTVEALEALKLKEITTEQVQLMDPREIHLLFKSFAGDFFIKLYLYGFMGIIFGVNLYLSIALGLVDILYSKKIDKVEINTKNIFKE